MAFSLIACATSSDLRDMRSDINRQMEEKLVAVDTRLAAIQKEQEKNTTALSSMRKGQANTTADFSELRDQIQQLRGQVETLKKDMVRDSKKTMSTRKSSRRSIRSTASF
jgi:chromosome segregation ATPase